jgi:hypothetical protein
MDLTGSVQLSAIIDMSKKFLILFYLSCSSSCLFSQNNIQDKLIESLRQFEDSVRKKDNPLLRNPYFFSVEIGNYSDSLNFTLKVSNNWTYEGLSYFQSNYCLQLNNCCFLLEPNRFDYSIAKILGFKSIDISSREKIRDFRGYGEHHVIDGYIAYLFIKNGEIKTIFK